MTVRRIFAGDAIFDVEGNGYAPEGKITSGGADLPEITRDAFRNADGRAFVQRFAAG